MAILLYYILRIVHETSWQKHEFIIVTFQYESAIKQPAFSWITLFIAFSWLEHFIGFSLGYIHGIFMTFSQKCDPVKC